MNDSPGRTALRSLDPFGDIGRAAPPGSATVDTQLCAEIADEFERAPVREDQGALRTAFRELRRHSLAQFHAIREAGITVRPWRGSGTPYQRSRDLMHDVVTNANLWVYLTCDGHGTHGTAADHPMRGASGVVCDGVPFEHNDVFRAVHDIFGHVIPQNSFSLAGELRAGFIHMRQFPSAAHHVIFTETVAQICWFYCGEHVRGTNALPVDQRPYPEQKVYRCSEHLFSRYIKSFN